MPRVKLDAATVPALLQRGGWPAERLTADTWRSTFRGRTGSFPVFVRVDHEACWVHFAIVPFLRSPEDEDGAHRLYTRLMQLNQQLLMAKFSIDDDLDAARRFWAAARPSFPVAWDMGGEARERFGVLALPTSVLLDAAGRIFLRTEGFDAAEHRRLEEGVRALVAT